MFFKNKKIKCVLVGVVVFTITTILSSWYYVYKNDWLFNNPYSRARTYLFEEKKLNQNIELSSDGSRFAYAERQNNGKVKIILDGERQEKEYDAVRELSFSYDGSDFAYFAERGNDRFIVLNGKELENHTDILFSPDSEEVAHIVEENGKKFVKVDNNKGEDYYSINYRSFIFSEDGSKFAYQAVNNERESVIVLNNEEVGGYHGSGDFQLSPDGSSFAYEAKNDFGEDWFVVLNGEKLKGVGGERRAPLRSIYFSSNNDFVYIGYPSTTGGMNIFFNGEKIANYDGIRDPIFSSSGENFAYIARKGSFRDLPEGRESLIVLNGEEQEAYRYISEHIFGSQETHFYLAEKEDNCFIIINGEKEVIAKKGVDEGIWRTRCKMENLMISKNEKRIAYKRTKYPVTLYNLLSSFFKLSPEEVHYITLDDKFHETYKHIDSMSFDKSGDYFAYRASDGDNWFVVLNGKELEKHDYIKGPVFSYGGESLSYVAVDDEIRRIEISLK